MVLIGMFAALIVVCSWIQIPAAVPFTLQTFAVFLTVGLLGGKRGTIAVLIYILLGMVGLPVFSGFKGGIGALLGTTGGYIIGFIFASLTMWLIEFLTALEKFNGVWHHKKSINSLEKVNGVRPHKGHDSLIASTTGMAVGLIVCYTFGTAWFVTVYTNTKEPIGILTALSWCVFPFIIPDIIKIILALVLSRRLRRYIP